MPQGIDPAVQSRCLVLYHAWLVGFACAVSPTGLCMKAFLFQFDSFSAAWVPIYLPVLTRASDGFFALSGIIQYAPAFCAPVMRPSEQRATTRRLERCQRFAASMAEIYFIGYTTSLIILYSQHGIMSRAFSIKVRKYSKKLSLKASPRNSEGAIAQSDFSSDETKTRKEFL